MTMPSRDPCPLPAPPLDVERLRKDFPILVQRIRGKPLVYLDNAATSQTPLTVISTIERFYKLDCSNIHRGVHDLSARATRQYEEARGQLARFVGAAGPDEIIFTRGTTEAINLVAAAWGGANLRAGDEVLITHLEHHSNIVPWQMACQRSGARLVVCPIDDRGAVDMEAMARLVTPRTRVVAVAHVSNALGTVVPVREIARLAHARGAVVLVDGAQAAPHMPIDVAELGCDFYALSGHKMYGPTGAGLLWGRRDLLKAMPPYQGGGDMIRSVTFEETTYADPPARFEAGTPAIAAGIALGCAAEYLTGIGRERIAAHEALLLQRATEALSEIPRVRLVGTAPDKASVVSFVIEGVHPHDIGTILDGEGVAIRAGHHCAQPVMARFGLPATARASFGFYNTLEEIDILAGAVRKAIDLLG